MLNVYKKGMKCRTFFGGKLEKKSFSFFIWLNSVSASEKLVLSMQGKKPSRQHFFWVGGLGGGGGGGGGARAEGVGRVVTFFGWFFIAPACSRVRYRRPIFCPSVKVSILINYKTKQPSNLA